MMNFGELQLVSKHCQEIFLPKMLMDRDLNFEHYLATAIQNLNPTIKKKKKKITCPHLPLQILIFSLNTAKLTTHLTKMHRAAGLET